MQRDEEGSLRGTEEAHNVSSIGPARLTPSHRRRWPMLLAVLAVSIVTLWWVVQGATYVRKFLILVVAPSAIFWLGLWCCLGLFAWRRHRMAIVLLLCVLLGYGVCGNDYVANWAVRTLERDFYHDDPFELEEMDALIVLGGGASSRRNGEFSLNGSGDRVMLAARLYQLGNVRRIITCGSAIIELGQTPNQGDAVMKILRDVGVPAAHIEHVAGTRTGEEMVKIKRHLADRGYRRVGLVTSAWHMPRALRIAERNGLEFIPLAADFRSDGAPGPTLFRFIPTTDALGKTHLACVEYVAMLLGK